MHPCLRVVLALTLAVALASCAKVEYLASDGKTPTHRATAYFPYAYEAATGDIKPATDSVALVIDGLVALGPEALKAGLAYLEKKTPAAPPVP